MTPGTATLLSLLESMRECVTLGDRTQHTHATYTRSFPYGGCGDVPWEWMRLWGWTHGIEEDRMDMICNPVYLTNIVRCWENDEAVTVGTTIKYAGLPPSTHLEGEVSLDEPTELAADFLWNVVTHLQLRTPDEISAFFTVPLETGQRLELLDHEEVDILVTTGVHIVPDPAEASDTAAMVTNATVCMRAVSHVIEAGAQNVTL